MNNKTKHRVNISRKDIKILGKNILCFKEEDEIYWELYHTSRQSMMMWYDKLLHKCIFTHLSFDLTNFKSFGVVMVGDEAFKVFTPFVSNGDYNWESYPQYTQLYTRIEKFIP